MSLDEKIRELDGQIASRVKQWLREQHELLGRKLGEEISRQLDKAGDFLPESLISADVKAELQAAASPEPAPVQASSSDLREAIIAVDAARTQATTLAALLAEGSRFASRMAVFLVRSEEAIGWKSQGFGEAGEALRSLSIAFRDGGPWDRLAEGRASVRMSAVDCARLCSRIESPLPKRGLLIPLVLRDQVAAAIYADQLGDDGALDAEALQILTFSAAQAIETLPFRQRSVTTPTLVFEAEDASSDDDHSSQGLSLWGAAGAPATEETVEEAPVEASSSEEDVDFEAPDTQDVGPIVEEILEAGEDAEGDTEEDTAAPELEAVEDLIDAPVVEKSSGDDLEPPEPLEVSEDFDAPVPDPAVETVAEPEALTWQDEVEVIEEPETVESLDPENVEVWEAEPVVAPEEVGELPSLDPDPIPEAPDPAALETVEPAADGLQTLHYPVPTLPETPPVEPSPVTGSDGYPEPDETVLLSRPPSLRTPTTSISTDDAFDGDETHPGTGSAAPVVEPPAPVPPTRASEVAPPSDIDGPGWAFGNRVQPVAGDEEMHEKAKRLARLLVSEIKLYNEEQVEEGQRNGNIYERLKEDIDRSRQMYEDRVDERVRTTNDYFYQELVRTLASGDAQALGI